MTGSSETPISTGDVFGATFDEIHGSTYLERDAHGLARLGKSQVLKVCCLHTLTHISSLRSIQNEYRQFFGETLADDKNVWI